MYSTPIKLTHPSTPSSVTRHSHPPLTGRDEINTTNTTTPHHHNTAHLYAEKYRLHGETSSVYRTGSRHGTGTIYFLSFWKITPFTQNVLWSKYKNRSTLFVHLTGPGDLKKAIFCIFSTIYCEHLGFLWVWI